MHSLVRRIPMALGPVFGGLCIGLWGERNGVRIAFVAALILSFIAALLQQLLIDENPTRSSGDATSSGPEKNPLRLFHRMAPSLKRLLVSDILVRF